MNLESNSQVRKMHCLQAIKWEKGKAIHIFFYKSVDKKMTYAQSSITYFMVE